MSTATIRWSGGIDGHVELIDQTLLPAKVDVLEVRNVEAMWDAIKRLAIRGAPAIGIAAAYGAVLALQQVKNDEPVRQAIDKLGEAADYLATSRPTAVNLFWALKRMTDRASASSAASTGELKEDLLTEARAIRDEDAAMCRAIGTHGARLIKDGLGVLTHCNAGALATAEFGTALAPMFIAQQEGRKFRAYASETRPLLQGARLTTWELTAANIDTTLVCDNMVGYLMSLGKIDLVITGADRIAANGDTANKIGTYGLAILARAHSVPFYVAAPSSTFDMSIDNGDAIPIEQRQPEEVTHFAGTRVAANNVQVFNPAFDITPHRYITAIITDKGLIEQPDTNSIAAVLKK